MQRHLLGWLLWWIALFWLWLLLAGDWNRIEWIAAACAATVGATVAELARSAAGVAYRPPPRRLGRSWAVPAMVVVDFGIVMWALVRSLARRQVVRGAFRERRFDAGGDDAASASVRAWTVIAATYSPDAYVVGIDRERNTVLLHDLIPFERSEEPAT